MKTISRLLTFLIVISMLAACEQPRQNRGSPAAITVKEITTETGCECQRAQRYKLVNTNATNRSISFEKHEMLVNQDIVNNISQTEQVPANGETVLECSIEKDKKKSCNKVVTYNIRGINYPSTPADVNRDVVINKVKANIAFFDSDLSPNNQCLNLCLNNPGPACTSFDATGSTDVAIGWGIAGLLGNIAPDGKIRISELVQWNDGNNTCNRTDFVFEDSIGYNYGDKCDIGGSLPASGGSTSISIPSSLFLSYSKLGAENFQLKFYKSKAAPSVEFSDPTMQSAFGGSVMQLDYNNGAFIMQHESNSCFEIKVK